MARSLSFAPIRAVCAGAAVALALSACGGGSESASRGTTPTTVATTNTTSATASTAAEQQRGGPCAGHATPPAVYDHVIWIWMENKGFARVIGNADAPYETSVARLCATATRFSGVGEPSLPNYLAATSGSTHGVFDDDPPADHPITADNLFRQVRARGGTARSYQESMPGNCALDSSGRYAVKHNPAAYYVGGSDRSACKADDVPLGDLGDGALRHDVDADTLPAFSFVTPDLCNDTHDCSVATGDRWLQQWLPVLLSSNSYAAGTTAIFVMWDEGSPIPFLAIAPTVPAGTVLDAEIDHYAVLRTTEEMLGIPTQLGAAAHAPSIRASLHA
ncbi:MAG: alkaline phosphatase family protein [Acidimicrobiia bacterium]